MKESFSILNASSNVSDNLFIEASAGTGKTFAIQHLVVRKVLEAKEALLPKECAIITFTKAVAEELLSRISDSLDQAIQALKDKKNSLEYLKPYLDEEEKRIRALNRLILFRRDIESCRITTIHGFCLQLLQEYFGSPLQMVEPVAQNRLMKELIEYELTSDTISLGQFQGVRRLFGFNDAKLLAALITHTSEVQFDPLNISLESFFESHSKDELYSTLDELSFSFKNLRDKLGNLNSEPASFFRSISELCDPQTRKQALYAIEKSAITLPKLFSEMKKKCTPNEQALQKLEQLTSVLENHCSPKKSFYKLKNALQQGFERVCYSKNLFTFDLLIKRAKSLTQEDINFRTFILDALKLVIVDEFQDTDLLQWGLLSTLFLDGNWGGNLYLVGDPKQSIYAFRAADVYCYLDAKSKIGAQKSLKTNYRSTDGLVLALNTIFTGPWADSLFHLPKLKSALAVDVVEAHRSTASSVSPISFVLFNSSLGRKRTWPTDEILSEQLMPWLAHELYSLQKQGYGFSQIAILVKDRYQARDLESYLETVGIPATSLKTVSVVDSPASKLLSALYGWLASPKQLSRLKELLAIHKSIFSLESIPILDDPEQGFAVFGAYLSEAEAILKIVRRHGIAAAYDAFLQCRMYPTTASFADDSCYTDELKRDSGLLLDLLSEEEIKRPFSVEDAYLHLSTLEENYGLDSERLQRRFDPERDSVTLITTHKSKGLEFDVVIPLGVSCRSPQPSNLDSEQKIIETEAEKARLLYVALTRARDKLIIPVFVERDEKPISFGIAAPLEKLLQSILNTDHYSVENVETACQTLVNSSQGTISLCSAKLTGSILEPKQEVRPQMIPEVFKPITWAQQSRTSFSKAHKGSSDSGTSDGRLIGIFIHSLIKLLIEEKDLQDKKLIQQFVLQEVQRSGFKDDLAVAILKVLYSPMQLFGRKVILSEIPKERLLAEASFCIQDGNTQLVGSIDCIVKLDDCSIILDWKSHLTNEPLEMFAKSLNCESQAKMYRKAVEKTGIPCLGVAFVFVRILEGDSCGIISY